MRLVCSVRLSHANVDVLIAVRAPEVAATATAPPQGPACKPTGSAPAHATARGVDRPRRSRTRHVVWASVGGDPANRPTGLRPSRPHQPDPTHAPSASGRSPDPVVSLPRRADDDLLRGPGEEKER